jgi:hypothetical protein
MPSTSRPGTILLKAGVQVPPFPARRLPVQERYLRKGVRIPQEEVDADAAQRQAVDTWRAAVNSMYEVFLAARSLEHVRPTAT